MDDCDGRKVLWIREIRAGDKGHRLILCASEAAHEVRVGDIFRKCYERSRQTPGEVLDGCDRPKLTDFLNVELTVVAIEWPKGNASNLLPRGHTGAIQFVGAGVEYIIAGRYLEA
jgi:hypothetical protein